MKIDVWTLLFQAINFAVLAYVLHRVLYRPVLEVLDQRAAEAREADEREQRLAKAQQEQEQRAAELTAKAEADGQALIAKARTEAEAAVAEGVARAEAEAKATTEQARARLAQERAQVEAATRKDLADAAIRLATTLVTDATGAGVTEALLERLLERVGSLPDEDRRRLEEDLRHGTLVVAAWPDPDDATRQRWTERLRALLGEVEPTWVADPALVAGVELRAPTQTLGVTWRDALDEGREVLVAAR
ncbi:MAG: ATP synthase F0 subunit B [Alphaproteobacteria bacterium]|nr:ATP synthase F0 subunit B [Alphaproteobacteria bacterium]